jgi:hypothetical protein
MYFKDIVVAAVTFMCVIPVVCLTNKEGGEVRQHN